jgi:hypothetical protein
MLTLGLARRREMRRSARRQTSRLGGPMA